MRNILHAFDRTDAHIDRGAHIDFRQSVAVNVGIEDAHVVVFLDHSNQQDRMAKIAKNHGPPNVHIVRRKRNIGCGRNAIGARRYMFDKLGVDRAVVIEDDVVISKYFLAYLCQLHEWASQFSDVGAVQAWSPCWWSKNTKRQALGEVIEVTHHLQGYMISREVWGKIRGLLEKYDDQFIARTRYNTRPHNKIRAWMKAHILKGKATPGGEHFAAPSRLGELRGYFTRNPATGQDAVTNLALWRNGLRRIAPKVNRMINIGEDGIHMSRRTWISMGFDQVRMDDFEEDLKPLDFQACDIHKGPELKVKR